MAGSSNGSAAVVPDQVDLNIVFTGTCSYAVTAFAENHSKMKATFLMPNTRKWRNSLNKGDARIPPHRPFLIARIEDVATENGLWKGEEPTGSLYGRWVYWIFGGDQITIDQLPESGVTVGNTADVVHLPTLCTDAEVSPYCLTGRSEQVSARVIFQSGRLTQRSLTTGKYTLTTCRGATIGPKEIADEVQIAIRNVPRNARGEIIFHRRVLDGSRDGRNPIILRPFDALTMIFFGSAPEADLGAVVKRAPNHLHDDTNVHFELHYDISLRRPYAPVPVPERAQNDTGTGVAVSRSGPIAGTDRCPPASGGK